MHPEPHAQAQRLAVGRGEVQVIFASNVVDQRRAALRLQIGGVDQILLIRFDSILDAPSRTKPAGLHVNEQDAALIFYAIVALSCLR